jgi:hypothetical protein
MNKFPGPRQRGSVIRALLEQQGLFEKRKRNHVAKFLGWIPEKRNL